MCLIGHHFDLEVLESVGWRPGDNVPWHKPVPEDVVEKVSSRAHGALQYDGANRLKKVGVDGDNFEKPSAISGGPFCLFLVSVFLRGHTCL